MEHGSIRGGAVQQDPVADLVAVGVVVFRRLVLEHPALDEERAWRDALTTLVRGFNSNGDA